MSVCKTMSFMKFTLQFDWAGGVLKGTNTPDENWNTFNFDENKNITTRH